MDFLFIAAIWALTIATLLNAGLTWYSITLENKLTKHRSRGTITTDSDTIGLID